MREFVVLKKEGKSGLTLGARVLKPGHKFTKKDWPYADENLEAAIKDGRCEEIVKANITTEKTENIEVDKKKARLSKHEHDTEEKESE